MLFFLHFFSILLIKKLKTKYKNLTHFQDWINFRKLSLTSRLKQKTCFLLWMLGRVKRKFSILFSSSLKVFIVTYIFATVVLFYIMHLCGILRNLYVEKSLYLFWKPITWLYSTVDNITIWIVKNELLDFMGAIFPFLQNCFHYMDTLTCCISLSSL